MVDLTQRMPGYLTQRKNIWTLVIYTAAFALVFINIYAPFGVETWYNISKWELFFYSSLIILTGVLVVALSRVVMYQLVHRRRMYLNIGQYLIWIGAEIVGMALFYALFEWLILHDPRPFWIMYRIAFVNTSLVLMLPYAVLWLYFAHQDSRRMLQQLEQMAKHKAPPLITFFDEKGQMRLSMKAEDLLYLKGADNYIELVYRQQDRIARFHLRNSMKRLEEMLQHYPIVRCHRSYMVNLQKIQLVRRTPAGMVLQLDTNPVIELPVSRSYTDQVFRLFGQIAGSSSATTD